MRHGACPWWVAYTFDNPLRRFFHDPEKILGPYVGRGMTVLDAGCGLGYFSIGLARLVGEEGLVIAADVQEKMLKAVVRRARKVGLADRIRIHKSEPENLGVDSLVDFILAFWMVHEAPDAETLFRQFRACLNPEGKVLIAEPKIHVSSKDFQRLLSLAKASGLNLCETPSIRLSRSAVLTPL